MLTDQLSDDALRVIREWCTEREAGKPWYKEAGDSPKLVVKCDFMIAVIDEVLAGRAALEEKQG